MTRYDADQRDAEKKGGKDGFITGGRRQKKRRQQRKFNKYKN